MQGWIHSPGHRKNLLSLTNLCGIGVGKKRYLEAEKGACAVEMMRTIKRALDPLNLLNPGKVIDL